MEKRRVIVNIYSNLNPLELRGLPQCISVHGIQRSIKSTLPARTTNEKNGCVRYIDEENFTSKWFESLMKVMQLTGNFYLHCLFLNCCRLNLLEANRLGTHRLSQFRRNYTTKTVSNFILPARKTHIQNAHQDSQIGYKKLITFYTGDAFRLSRQGLYYKLLN